MILLLHGILIRIYIILIDGDVSVMCAQPLLKLGMVQTEGTTYRI